MLVLLAVSGICPTWEAATWAATIDVTNTNDSGAGSLREAIANANNGDTINITANGTINLASSLPSINKDLTIEGPGNSNLEINGGFTHRVFFVEGGTVTIKDIAVFDGRAKGGDGGDGQAGGGGGMGAGGGVFVNDSADVTLENVRFNRNRAIGGEGGSYVSGDGSGGGGGLLGNGGNGGQEAGGGGGGTIADGSDGTSTLGGAGGAVGGGDGGDYSPPGAAADGGDFGGGGGAENGGTSGGAGGYGGGGGGKNGTAGFGGGDGGPTASTGDGGDGLGGTVFVRQGGSLTINNTNASWSDNSQFNNGYVSGGNGNSVGSAEGGGLYLHGVAATIDVAGGAAVVNSAIGGSGSIIKTGTGMLTLSIANTYSGGTAISQGTVDVTADNNLGDASGGLSFDGGTLLYSAGFASARDVTFNAGGGTFNTNGFDAGLSGDISGSGIMTKAGTGTLALSGAVGHTGGTNIIGGKLVVNGIMDVDTNVAAGAALGGNVTVHNLDNQGGTITPGNSIGSVAVTGNYTHSATATYEAEINNSGQSDLINVTGTANIGGGTVDFQAEAGTYTPGTRYTILTAAGGVFGQFGTVTDNMPDMRTLLTYNAFDIEMLLLLTYSGAAQTPNQTAVAAVLEQIALSPSGDFQTVLAQLDSVINNPGAEQYLDQLGGEVFGTTASVGLESTSLFLETISRRLRTISGFTQAGGSKSAGTFASRSFDNLDGIVVRGQSSSRRGRLARGISCWQPWVQGYGVSGNASSNGNASGFSYGIGGTTVAIDRMLDNSTHLGLVGGYGSSQVYLDGPAQRAFVDSGQIALYLQRTSRCHYLTGIFSYAHNSYDTSRQIAFGNLNRTASADYHGDELAARLEAGRVFQLRKLQFQPYVALQYINLYQSGFTEIGAGAINLNVDGVQTDSLRGSLGSRLVWYDRSVKGRVLAPELHALWRHEFLDEGRLVGADFIGAPGNSFVVAGADLGRDAAVLGGGYAVYFGNRLSLFANYDVLLNNVEVAHAGTGGLQFLW